MTTCPRIREYRHRQPELHNELKATCASCQPEPIMPCYGGAGSTGGVGGRAGTQNHGVARPRFKRPKPGLVEASVRQIGRRRALEFSPHGRQIVTVTPRRRHFFLTSPRSRFARKGLLGTLWIWAEGGRKNSESSSVSARIITRDPGREKKNHTVVSLGRLVTLRSLSSPSSPRMGLGMGGT